MLASDAVLSLSLNCCSFLKSLVGLTLRWRFLVDLPKEPEDFESALVVLERPMLDDSKGLNFSPPLEAYGVLTRGSNGAPACSLNCLSGSACGWSFGGAGGGSCFAVGALRRLEYADVFAAGGSSPPALFGAYPFLLGIGGGAGFGGGGAWVLANGGGAYCEEAPALVPPPLMPENASYVLRLASASSVCFARGGGNPPGWKPAKLEYLDAPADGGGGGGG